jgi:hypothetical protein
MKTLEPFNVIEDRMGRRYYLDRETAHPESTADLYVARKRFSDAELAAEVFFAVFHEAQCEVEGRKLQDRLGPDHPGVGHWVKHNHEYARQAPIAERFATLPHASESDYQ